MGSGWNHGTTTRTMEERLDPLQQAFSTPIAASHAGSVAVPPYDSGGILSENLFVNFPRSGTKPPTGKSRESFASTNTGSISATTSVHTASTNDREFDLLLNPWLGIGFGLLVAGLMGLHRPYLGTLRT